MSFLVSRRDIQAAARRARSMTSRSLSGGSSGAKAVAIRQAESGFAAFSYGVLEGWKGPITIGPFSGDFIAATLLHLAALSGMADAKSEHLHNLAQGFADGYLHRLGVGLGTKIAQDSAARAGLPNAPQAETQAAAEAASNATQAAMAGARRGYRGFRPGRDLTRAEIASMAEAARR